METKAKPSIEEAADQLLIWKVKGKGKYPHPIRKAKLCSEAIQYLVDKGYVVQTGETPKCLDYHLTLEGFEHVYGVDEYLKYLEELEYKSIANL